MTKKWIHKEVSVPLTPEQEEEVGTWIDFYSRREKEAEEEMKYLEGEDNFQILSLPTFRYFGFCLACGKEEKVNAFGFCAGCWSKHLHF